MANGRGGRLGKPIFGGSVKNNLDVGKPPWLPDGIGTARTIAIPPHVGDTLLGDDMMAEQEIERLNRQRDFTGRGERLPTSRPAKLKNSKTHQVP